MNRGGSRDSLDNFDDDLIRSSSGSSSPTNFTSDDESHIDNQLRINPMIRDPLRSSSKHGENIPITLTNYNRPYVIKHAPGSSTLEPAQRLYTKPLGQNQPKFTFDREDKLFSTYQYGHFSGNNHPSNQHHHSHHRHLDTNRTIYKDEQFDKFYDPLKDSLPAEQEESYADLQRGNDVKMLDFISSSYTGANGMLKSAGLGSRSLRGSNTMASRLLARLLECRTLIEAIEFVELNRGYIESTTRIITHEAPAYRDYDMTIYQIDNSVKESFNPNFWLDREPIVTTADGNCQYHAVSLSLTGTEAYTSEVRLATAVAVIDNREWFDGVLKSIDGGTVLDLIYTIVRNYSWGNETTLKATAVAINKRIFLYACNMGKKDYEMVKLLSKEELLDAFREKKYRGGTGIHTYADPLMNVPADDYIMLFHKSEHFIAVLPTTHQPVMYEPYNPIVPVFN